MAQTFDVSDEWNVGARYTAASETDILLSNPDARYRRVIRWTLTTSDTVPTMDVEDATVLRGGENIPMTLNAGERLWVAGQGAKATIEI